MRPRRRRKTEEEEEKDRRTEGKQYGTVLYHVGKRITRGNRESSPLAEHRECPKA